MICDYCRSQCMPPVDEDGVQVIGHTAWPCTACRTPLSRARIEALDVLYCTVCHGILVSMNDFGLLIDELREHRARSAALLTPGTGPDSRRDQRCPLCEGPLDHHAYGGGDIGRAMMDSCEDCCQVWLQRGALGNILITSDSEAATRAQ
jgi:Zn-finger nucleic acid-binding protein